jgi:hypothetical protein
MDCGDLLTPETFAQPPIRLGSSLFLALWFSVKGFWFTMLLTIGSFTNQSYFS